MSAGGAPRAGAVGNYVLTGRVLGKGHFARVEEATHVLLHHKVAIKVIDLTCIREEYARRHLHREPRLLARLSHPCIVALYETMMHGPRLYLVLEAACGGDLSALVAGARGGLPERRARALAAQLVSAVGHMHDRGIVHRDLKMENIMLDSTKQCIKIVDFGLSNVWTAGGGLRTPCGSLEYAAPELLAPASGSAPGRRYGPPLDLWSIGVIVYGMVTGALPFTATVAAAAAGAGARGADADARDRPQLRQMIARGLGRKQRAALALTSPECGAFVARLLETRAEARMSIAEAANHGWLREGTGGRRLHAQPLPPLDRRATDEIYQRLAVLCKSDAARVAARVAAAPHGALGGMYRIEAHRRQLAAADAGGVDDPRHHRPRPAPDVSTRDVAIDHRKLLNVKPRHVVTSMKPPTSVRVPSGSYAARAARAHHAGDGEPTRASATPHLRHEKCVIEPNASRPPARAGSGGGPSADRDTTIDYHRRTGNGLPSWHSSSVPSTPLKQMQKNNVPIKRTPLRHIVSPKQPIHDQCRSENGTLKNWSKATKESVHLRYRRNPHPKGPPL